MKKIFFILSMFLMAQASISLAFAEERADDLRDGQSVEKVTSSVVVADNCMFLSGVKAGTKVVVVNMLGVPVMTFETNSDNERVALSLKKGFYVVKMENLVQRFVIR